MRFVSILTAALTIAHPFEGLAQDAAARAAAVLAQMRQALGGEELLGAIATLQASGGFRRTMGEMEMEGELEVLIEAPGKLRRNEQIFTPGGGRMVRTEVLNGEEVWDDGGARGGHGGGGVQIVMRGPGSDGDPARLKEIQRASRRAELARLSLALLATTSGTMRHAGVAEAPDGSAEVIEVIPADGPPMRLFVDRKTHLPLMIAWQGPQPRVSIRRQPGGGGNVERETAPDAPPAQATFEMRLADYRVVNGVKLPHLVARSIDGRPNEEWTVARYVVNAPLGSKVFTR